MKFSIKENFIFCAVSNLWAVLHEYPLCPGLSEIQRHLPEVFYKNRCIVSTLRLRPVTLSKDRLWHRCFPVNYATFLRAPFLQYAFGSLLLKIQNSKLFWIYVYFNPTLVPNTEFTPHCLTYTFKCLLIKFNQISLLKFKTSFRIILITIQQSNKCSKPPVSLRHERVKAWNEISGWKGLICGICSKFKARTPEWKMQSFADVLQSTCS